jgi:hypothetical protein
MNDGLAECLDFTRIGSKEASKYCQESRFATTRRAHENGRLAREEINGNISQRKGAESSFAETAHQMFASKYDRQARLVHSWTEEEPTHQKSSTTSYEDIPQSQFHEFL